MVGCSCLRTRLKHLAIRFAVDALGRRHCSDQSMVLTVSWDWLQVLKVSVFTGYHTYWVWLHLFATESSIKYICWADALLSPFVGWTPHLKKDINRLPIPLAMFTNRRFWNSSFTLRPGDLILRAAVALRYSIMFLRYTDEIHVEKRSRLSSATAKNSSSVSVR